MIKKFGKLLPHNSISVHGQGCNCGACLKSRQPYAGYHAIAPYQAGMWDHGYYGTYVSCNHFRQKVEFGDKNQFTMLCSAHRDIPKKKEELDKAIVPFIGVYMDTAWDDDVDPIKVSPGVSDYPHCSDYYNTILVKWADRGVPAQETLTELVNYLQPIVESGKLVDVGCFGGHGRTGTLLGCLIARITKMDPGDVIKFVREKYCKEAIESKVQEEAIYWIVGQEPPKPEPIKTYSPIAPSTNSYYTRVNYNSYDNWPLQTLLGLSRAKKIEIVTADKCAMIHDCLECSAKILISQLCWHTPAWRYTICDHCYRDMKDKEQSSQSALPSTDSNEGKWEVSCCGNNSGVFDCDGCHKKFYQGDNMWHNTPNWHPLLCDTCHLGKDTTDTPEIQESLSEKEKDQFAEILGFKSYKAMDKDIRRVLAKS